MLARIWQWLDLNILALGREMRLSYLPPLMVYMAYGVSGLTGIVGTFFVKEYLGLSAAFLAGLAFWVNVPWILKMPLGHLVDLVWRWKSGLVFLGAGLVALSLLIMVGLLTDRAAMETVMSAEAWFVTSTLLAPIGYVLQDVVADAMTVEAVPRADDYGNPIGPAARRLMHTTMQTLGRVAIIGGTVLVALINLYVFTGVSALPQEKIALIYRDVYLLALVIPITSVAGVITAMLVRRRDMRRLRAQGLSRDEVITLFAEHAEETPPNWWILGGSIAFVIFTLAMGFSRIPFNQEVIFAGSFAIVIFLIAKLTRELEPEARATLIGTAVVIFAFRAVPTPGEGLTWWMIDELGFDQHFLSILSLIGGTLALVGMFIFRRFMAERSIGFIIGVLTVASAIFALPILGMYFGLHEWTAARTGGVVDARFIAIVNTALESPLGQVAMIPMLAWIANSAPANLKATYFAVMASFTNLALSLAQLGTRYLNQIFIVSREVRDVVTSTIQIPADYSQLGELLITHLGITIALPFAAILIVRHSRWRWA
jgi:hypothetical protein